MYTPPDKDRLSKLNLDGINMGQTIIFCPECYWLDVDAAMKPVCPVCSASMHVSKVDEDLKRLKK